ncbi:MAG: DUF6359 domain-containing protein [Muribaculaceae bacterium]|nr:DUF6359 domain-containing protein [Muribaculaceae bacterium]
MKKLLLTFASAVALAFSAAAAEPTVVDFTSAPAITGADPATSQELNGVTVYFHTANAYINDNSKYNNPNYVMLKPATGAISFSLPFDCAKIVLTTTGGCSTNAGNKISLYAGDDVVASKVAVNKQNTDFPFDLSGHTAAGTVYKFINDNNGGKNNQIAKLTFYPATSDPSIEAEFADIAFATALGGEQEITVKLLVANITDDITIASDNDAFTVPAKATVAEATEGIVVKYTGAAAGNAAADITFTAAGKTAIVSATAVTVAHAGTETDPLTVADVLTMNSLNTATFYVKGTIGELTCNNAKDGMVTEVAEASKNVKTNIILKDGDKMIGMVLPNGEIREAFNIVDNPTNVGKTVLAQGALGNYFGAPGLPSIISAEFDTSTGIDSIVADENAPVEYFNLQGVRVAQPEAGLYIRRQGTTVTKVLVK